MSDTPAPTARPDADAPDALIDGDSPRRPWWRSTMLFVTLLLALSLVAGWVIWSRQDARQAPVYVTQPVTRGSLTVTVTANGTLQPTRLVAVGSELSGTVAKVHVDVNDRVRRGQVLAELDTSRLLDQVTRSRAALAAAQALVRQSEVTADEAQATLGRLEDVSRRSGGEVPSRLELDGARTALQRAQAAVTSAQAGVAQARAALSSDETSLRKAALRSPIDGVVLSRAVDPGNAVAASLQAVTLFTLAEDLARMTLQVNIDEADVGQVRPGQAATFSVSAHPQRRYPATIDRLRYGSTVKDNVVTYLADLTVSNADLSLRPGMTATASIITLERIDALRVPNAALRFNPSSGDAAGPSGSPSLVSRLMPRPPASGQPPRRAGTDTSRVRQVWVLDGHGGARAIAVTPGASDGRHTEVTSDELRESMAVIVEQRAASAR